MTDTKTPSPSDAEIAELRAQFGITSDGRGIKEFSKVADFTRTVLARWGTQPAGLSAALLSELRGYLTAAADSSMSRNNSEALASELLEQMDKELGATQQPAPVREPQPMPDLTQLTERGAEAWAGVDAQALREGGITKGGQHGAE